jgi:soluble lytic murein transglycosylase-like protein
MKEFCKAIGLLGFMFVLIASIPFLPVKKSPLVPVSLSLQVTRHPSTSQVAPGSGLSSDYHALARQDAQAADVDPDIFERQIQEESGFNPKALSPAGAEGIAQFMPQVAASLGVNPWDPVSALAGAARLMASYLRKYDGDYAKALAAYNAGSARVASTIDSCGANWRACLPIETQRYIVIILQAVSQRQEGVA